MGSTIAASSDGYGTRSAEFARLSVQCSPEAVDAVAEILREVGAYGVEILGDGDLPPGDDLLVAPAMSRPSEVAIYLPATEGERTHGQVLALCAGRVEPYFGPVEVAVTAAPTVDWVDEYRRSVKALRVVPGIWVEPPWGRAQAAPGELVLTIMPGAAFGFGDHPTTVTCLRLLKRWLRPADDVIDLGSGSGILGAAALKLGAGTLRAYDLDTLAVEATRDTLRRNGLKAYVRQGTLPAGGRKADLILANISGWGLRSWLTPLRRAVGPEGRLILGGILREDRDFDGELRSAGLTTIDETADGDWRAIAARLA